MHSIHASVLLSTALLAMGCAAATAAERLEGAPEPRAPLLSLRVVEPVRAGRAVVLEIENEGPRPVPVPGARARVEVRRDGAPVRECSATGIPYEPLAEAEGTLRPGEARRFVTSLPCALEAPGDYALLVEVVVGASEDPFLSSPLEDHLAASAHVRVEAEEG
jgi:hypothetical protein